LKFLNVAFGCDDRLVHYILGEHEVGALNSLDVDTPALLPSALRLVTLGRCRKKNLYAHGGEMKNPLDSLWGTVISGVVLTLILYNVVKFALH
jgi:hypothetical protein